MINLTIPGQPQGKGRPRLGKYTTYTPDKTRNYEAYIQWLFVDSYKGFKPLLGTFKIEVVCYYQIPKNFSKKKREAIRNGSLRPTTKPDVDNCLKLILDSLNSLCYKDDKQCVEATVKKYYTEDMPRTEITIEEL